ncbi:MAG: hypothetical protein H6Q15_957 [Bacteroidetes bacterium]|nr:hypothetical protein [Bacteroidota bacterium]
MKRTYIALLRGVNVGGKNKVNMKELIQYLDEKGISNSKYYLQSGNIIFDSQEMKSESLEEIISCIIKDKFNLEIPVIIIDKEIITNALTNNPFKDVDTERIFFMFIDKRPDDTLVESIKSFESIDSYIIDERVIYLNINPPYHETKLTNNFFEKKLKVKATTRNYNTTKKLIDL